MEDFGTADAVLNEHPDTRNGLISRLFFARQLTLLRTFLGLIGSYLGWFIALKAGVLVELRARWEVIVFFIGSALVAGLTRPCAAQRLNLASAAVGDDHVLDCMTLLLTTVELALTRLVLGTLDRSFGAIDNELQPRTGSQHLGHR